MTTQIISDESTSWTIETHSTLVDVSYLEGAYIFPAPKDVAILSGVPVTQCVHSQDGESALYF